MSVSTGRLSFVVAGVSCLLMLGALASCSWSSEGSWQTVFRDGYDFDVLVDPAPVPHSVLDESVETIRVAFSHEPSQYPISARTREELVWAGQSAAYVLDDTWWNGVDGLFHSAPGMITDDQVLLLREPSNGAEPYWICVSPAFEENTLRQAFCYWGLDDFQHRKQYYASVISVMILQLDRYRTPEGQPEYLEKLGRIASSSATILSLGASEHAILAGETGDEAVDFLTLIAEHCQGKIDGNIPFPIKNLVGDRGQAAFGALGEAASSPVAGVLLNSLGAVFAAADLDFQAKQLTLDQWERYVLIPALFALPEAKMRAETFGRFVGYAQQHPELYKLDPAFIEAWQQWQIDFEDNVIPNWAETQYQAFHRAQAMANGVLDGASIAAAGYNIWQVAHGLSANPLLGAVITVWRLDIEFFFGMWQDLDRINEATLSATLDQHLCRYADHMRSLITDDIAQDGDVSWQSVSDTMAILSLESYAAYNYYHQWLGFWDYNYTVEYWVQLSDWLQQGAVTANRDRCEEKSREFLSLNVELSQRGAFEQWLADRLVCADLTLGPGDIHFEPASPAPIGTPVQIEVNVRNTGSQDLGRVVVHALPTPLSDPKRTPVEEVTSEEFSVPAAGTTTVTIPWDTAGYGADQYQLRIVANYALSGIEAELDLVNNDTTVPYALGSVRPVIIDWPTNVHLDPGADLILDLDEHVFSPVTPVDQLQWQVSGGFPLNVSISDTRQLSVSAPATWTSVAILQVSVSSASGSDSRDLWVWSSGPIVTLTNAHVAPASGTASTIFRWEIEYTNTSGQLPQQATVWVNNVPHQLSVGEGNPASGVILYYQGLADPWFTNLFHFEIVADGVACRDPEVGSYAGPEVAIPTSTLSQGSVEPSSGTSTDTYTYRVTYTNLSGEWPDWVQLNLDNGELPGRGMTPLPGDDPTTGVVYKASVSGADLGPGEHSFSFMARLHSGDNIYYPGGWQEGPNVSAVYGDIEVEVIQDYPDGRDHWEVGDNAEFDVYTRDRQSGELMDIGELEGGSPQLLIWRYPPGVSLDLIEHVGVGHYHVYDFASALSNGCTTLTFRVQKDGMTSSTGLEICVGEVPVVIPVEVSNIEVDPTSVGPGAAEACIHYELSKEAIVTIRVHDGAGSIVRTIADHEPRAAGANSDVWDGTDDNGTRVPDGPYQFSVTALSPGSLEMVGHYAPVGTGPGCVQHPLGVGVADQVFYVADQGNGRITGFTWSGTPIGEFGHTDTNCIIDVGVDASGTIYVLEEAYDGVHIIRYEGPDDQEPSEFAYVALRSDVPCLDADMYGNVYLGVRDWVYKFGPDGQVLTSFQIHSDSGTANVSGVDGDQDGFIWVAHTEGCLQKYDQQGNLIFQESCNTGSYRSNDVCVRNGQLVYYLGHPYVQVFDLDGYYVQAYELLTSGSGIDADDSGVVFALGWLAVQGGGTNNVAKLLDQTTLDVKWGTVGVDSLLPTASISSPQTGEIIDGSASTELEIFGSATDEEFRYYVLEWTEGVPPSEDTDRHAIATGYTPVDEALLGTWDLSGLSSGDYTVRLRVYDGTGSTTEAELSIQFRDAVAPCAHITEPREGLLMTGTIVLEAGTYEADVDLVEFQCKPAGAESWSTILPADDQAPWRVYWDTRGVPSGVCSLRAVAADTVGNIDPSPSEISIMCDNDAPSAHIVSPSEGADVQGVVTVQAEAAAVDTDSVLFQYLRAGSLVWVSIGSPDTDAPWSVEWDVSNLIPDEYQIHAVASDYLGNTDTTPSTITINVIPDYCRLVVFADPAEGGTVTGGGTYDHGDTAPVTATANADWEFDNWTGPVADAEAASTTVLMDADKSVTAHFIPIQHTLTVVADPAEGGTVTGGGTYDHGVTAAVTADPNEAEGWEFDNWTGPVADTEAASTTVLMDGDKSVTAHFSPIQHTLTVVADPAEGGVCEVLSPGPGPYDPGTQIRVEAMPAPGYHFAKWTGTISSLDNPLDFVINSNTTLVAQFSTRRLTIGSLSGPPGATIAVPVTMDNADGLMAFDVVISWDAPWLTGVDVERGPNLPDDWLVAPEYGTGDTRVTGFGTSTALTVGFEGPLFRLLLEIGSEALDGEWSELCFGDVDLSDALAKPIYAEPVCGQLTVRMVEGFLFDSISSPQGGSPEVEGARPLEITVQALGYDGLPAAGYSGPVSLTANCGDVAPAEIEMVDGVWTGEVVILTDAADVHYDAATLAASDPALGISDDSDPFQLCGKGDLDVDADFTIFDLVRGVNVMHGGPIVPPPASYQSWAADTDCSLGGNPCGNGEVDIFDLVRIIRRMLDGYWPCTAGPSPAVRSAAAEEARVVDISPTLLTGQRGDPVSIAVGIDDALDIMAFDITLSFDDASLALVQAQLSDCVPAEISSGWLINASVTEPGSLHIIGLGLQQPMPGNGGGCALVDVDFEIRGDAPETSCSDIITAEVVLSDSQAQSIPAVPGDGAEVRIGPRQFLDVPLDYWAYREITACVQTGIVQGYDPVTYGPTIAVSRDQMAVFIARALAGGDDNVLESTGDPTFPDVTPDNEYAWCYKYVEYAVDQRVVDGYYDGLYHPDWTVTRAQTAVFVARSLVAPAGDNDVPRGPEQPTFWDVTQDNEWAWCYDHVEYIASEGVAQGHDDGGYHPDYLCSRDQMAVFIARAFGL